MRYTLFILLGLSLIDKLSSQVDTLMLKAEVDRLESEASIAAFLSKTFEADQKLRGNDASIESDVQRLISIAYFYNRFGYPSEVKFGEAANVPRFIWIHTKFIELRRLSFPLIVGALRTEQIDEEKVRSYYLRTIYKYWFDDTGNMDLDLITLFDTLKLNTSNFIPVNDIITKLSEIKTLNTLHKKESKTWNAAEKSKWITVNGERKFITYKTSPVEIFTLENCKSYFQKLHVDHSYERRELIKIGENKYKYKDQVSDKYFIIDGEGNLLFRSEKEIIDMYPLNQ